MYSRIGFGISIFKFAKHSSECQRGQARTCRSIVLDTMAGFGVTYKSARSYINK